MGETPQKSALNAPEKVTEAAGANHREMTPRDKGVLLAALISTHTLALLAGVYRAHAGLMRSARTRLASDSWS